VDSILHNNVTGTCNVYEAARRAKVAADLRVERRDRQRHRE
jgi:hypothetical protein